MRQRKAPQDGVRQAAASEQKVKNATPPAPPAKNQCLLLVAAACLCVGVLAALNFANTADGAFVYDDDNAVTHNQDVTGKDTSIADAFKNDFWGSPMASPLSNKSYRPLTVLSFRLHVLMADGALDPKIFHLTNIGLHVLASMLVVVVAREFLGSTGASFLCGLLFAAHPIHTEAVANIVGRADVLSCVFYLCGIFAYCKGCQYQSFCSRWTMLILSCVFGTAALLSKEIGITMFGICAVYDVIYAGGPWLSVRGWLTWASRAKGRIMLIVAAGAALLGMRLHLMQGTQPTFNWFDNPAAHSEDLTTKVLTNSFLAVYNMWLLVFPYWLCCDRSGTAIPLVTDISDPRAILAVCIIAVLAVLTLSSMCGQSEVLQQTTDGRKGFARPLLSSLCCLVIPFLPASNLLFPVGFVVAERILYIPSIGVCMLAAHVLCIRCSRALAVVLAACLLGGFTARTVARNRDWDSDTQLWQSAVEVMPSNSKAWLALGIGAKLAKDHDRALELLSAGAQRLPPRSTIPTSDVYALYHFFQFHDFLGSLQMTHVRNNTAALNHFMEALSCLPPDLGPNDFRSKSAAGVSFNTGILYQQQKQTPKAMDFFKRATELNPDNGHFSNHYSRMLAYMQSRGM